MTGVPPRDAPTAPGRLPRSTELLKRVFRAHMYTVEPTPRRALGAVTTGLLSIVAASVHAAEVRTTDDYIAIVVEAEDFATKNERWVLTNATTPAQENDPDANHSDGAVGGHYLELLPDIRVTHEDPFGPPDGYWPAPGEGPEASYPIVFPEPGRYHVHVRAYSTGTEDNGIHVGLDGNWPQSGRRLQHCSSRANDWRWSSSQRDSGGSSCGIEKTVWLTVDEAGPHEFRISAREDGYEIDRVMLVKDLTGNARTCGPVDTQADEIECKDGGVVEADEVVDLIVTLGSESEVATIGESVEVTATVSNRDALDSAHEIELGFELDPEIWRIETVGDACELVDGRAICTADRLEPKNSGETAVFSLIATPLVTGLLDVAASAASLETDFEDTDNTARLAFEVSEPLAPAALVLGASLSTGMVVVGEAIELQVVVENRGELVATGLDLSVELGAGLAPGDVPEGCSRSSEGIDCALESLAGGGSTNVTLPIRTESAGSPAVAVSVRADAVDPVSTSRLIVVSAEVGEEGGGETTGATDSGATTGGSGSDTAGGESGGSDIGGEGSSDGDVKSGQTSGGSGSAHPAFWWLVALVTFMRPTKRRAHASL